MSTGPGRWRAPWRRVFGLDLVLVHAASVWDCGNEVIRQGPLADVDPSTDEFEMCPIDLTSIAARLDQNHYNPRLRLVSVACRTLRNPRFDVARHPAGLAAPVLGVGRLRPPHAHGAPGVAELVKQVHPEARVLIGGLSATRYHEEVTADPAVDFVLRGDSTEEPCRQLLAALREGTALEAVENLTWKAMVRRSTARWSMQITIESPDPGIRKVNGKVPVPNEVVEATLGAALDEGCDKLDLFSMVGLSGQTPAIALQAVDYCRHLVERFGSDRRLQFYAAPLGPFLDPGSRAFEDPSLGYHRRFSTPEEHRQALLGPTWREMLANETDWMTRDQTVEATYALGAGLNDLKLEAGLIDAVAALEQPERRRAHRELEWKTTAGLRVSRLMARHTAAALPSELSHGRARLAGRHDTAVARVRRLPTGARLPVGASLQVGETHPPDGDGPAGRRRGNPDNEDAPVDAGRRE